MHRVDQQLKNTFPAPRLSIRQKFREICKTPEPARESHLPRFSLRPGSVSDRNKKSLFFLAKNHLLSLFRDNKKINFCLLGLDYLKLEKFSEDFLKSENFTKEDNFITFYFLISKKLNRSNFHFFSCSFDLFLFESSKSKNNIKFFSRQANRFWTRRGMAGGIWRDRVVG